MTTKADLGRAVVDLFEPLVPHFSEGGARVRLGGPAAVFGDDAEQLDEMAAAVGYALATVPQRL